MTHHNRIAGTLAVAGATILLAGCGESKPREPVAETTTTGPRPAARTTTVPAATTIDTTVDAGGVNPFAASSPWNTPVQSLERSRTSNAMIKEGASQPVLPQDRTRLQRKPQNRNLAINLKGWAPGVFSVGAGDPMTLVCRQDPCGKKGDLPPKELRLGNDLQADSAHDGWVVLVDQSSDTVWDLWRARRVGSTLSFEFVRKWTLDGDGVGTPASTEPSRVPSVRGSGLPMLAGLIRPREAKSGRIPHTLAMAVPGPASSRFVLPAGTTNGLASTNSLPEGARIRLKPSAYRRMNQRRVRSNQIVTINGRRQRSKRFIVQDGRRKRSKGATAVLQALYTYGAIIVDRADSPTLYAQSNANWKNILAANSLSELKLSDFEVVSLGRVFKDPASPPRARPSQESR